MRRPVPIAIATLLVGLAACVARVPIQGAASLQWNFLSKLP